MSFTVIQDIENLTLEEIEEKINCLKIEIINLNIKKATRQNIQPHIFKHKKHELSQLLTIQTKKYKITKKENIW
uniref:Ribosomal protein L29 n=1 Tax=Riquetophycus sp. TaxID=1897556 RepID=A0A1C9C8H0_9FLOR|nr:ribosomal protein L29 [Riquetophycus sp.]